MSAITDLMPKILRLLLIGITETWYVHFSLSALLDRNKRSKKLYMLMLLFYFLCTVFDAANDFRAYFVFSLAYVLIAVTAYLFYEGSNGVRLGISFVCISINYGCTIIAVLIYNGFILKQSIVSANNLQMNIVSQILLMVMCIPFVLLLSRIRKKPEASFKMFLVTAFLIPLAICILLLELFYLTQNPDRAKIMLEGQLITSALLLILGTMLYSILELNNSLENSLRYSATLEQMVAVQEKYYTDLQSHQQELRRIKHDIKNHMRVLGSLLDSGQYEEAKDYTKTLSDEISSISSPVLNCDNQLISALINEKLSPARDAGIEISTCVMVPATLSVKSVDICIILGNLLDNAVEACSKMSEDERRFIDVDIRLAGVFLSINISNSYSTPLNISKSKYLTTKKDERYHGLGISNVKRVVDKYDGRMTITHEKNIFSVSCLLSYSES